jgi:hypothetical protein
MPLLTEGVESADRFGAGSMAARQTTPGQSSVASVAAAALNDAAVVDTVAPADPVLAIAANSAPASTALPSRGVVVDAEAGARLAAPAAPETIAKIGWMDNKNPIGEVAKNSLPASTDPVESGSVGWAKGKNPDLEVATLSEAASAASNLHGTMTGAVSQIAKDHLQSEQSIIHLIPLSQKDTSAIEPRGEISPAPDSALSAEPAVAQFKSTSLISLGQSAMVGAEPGEMVAKSIAAAQGTPRTENAPPKPVAGVASRQDGIWSPALRSNSSSAAASSLNPTAAAQPSRESVSSTVASLGDATSEDQRKAPWDATASSGTALEAAPMSAARRAADTGQSVPQPGVPASVLPESVVAVSPSATFPASPAVLESTVEPNQSAAAAQTVAPATVRSEAKSPVPVRPEARAELTAAQAVKSAAPQLVTYQALPQAAEPRQVELREAGTSVAPVSGQGVNASLAEPVAKQVTPSPTDSGIFTSIVAASSAIAPSSGTGSLPLPSANRSLATVGERAAVSGVSRTTRGSGAFSTGQAARNGLREEASISLVEASAGAREQAGLQGAGLAVQAALIKQPAAASDPVETFAALDGQSATGREAWTYTGAQRAEAGFQDPELGWVAVRADGSGSGIHAQLVAGSTDAAQALSGQMAGLNAFLVEHRTPVETLTLTTSGGGTGSSSDGGAGAPMQQGSGDQTGRQAAQSAGADSLSGSASSRAHFPEGVLSKAARPAGLDESAPRAQWVGGHISVMA